jgi:hypothetical protein
MFLKWVDIYDAWLSWNSCLTAFVSQSKRVMPCDSQWDEMGVNQGLEQDNKGNHNEAISVMRSCPSGSELSVLSSG